MQPSFLIFIFALSKTKAFMKHKTLPAFAILIFSCCTLHAQIEKRSLLLGATLGYRNSSTTSYSSSSNAYVNPRIGYAVGKNSVIGLLGNFRYGKSKYDNNPSYKSTSTTYGGALYWRQFLPIQNRLGWYTELIAGISGGINKTTTSTFTKTRHTNYAVGAAPGIYFQALPKLLISADVGGLNFNRSIDKNSNSDIIGRSSAFEVNFLKEFTFGIDFILGRKPQS
jgi:hypothetical protein